MKPKRVVSLLVAGCMAVSMVPASAVTAFAAETGTGSAVTTSAENEDASKPETSGTCGAEGQAESVSWEVKQNNTDAEKPTYTLTISLSEDVSSGAMADYNVSDDRTEDDRPWKSFAGDITEVKIAEGITRIGNSVFRGMNKLVSANIPASVTSLGDYIFRNDGELTTVTWADGFVAHELVDRDSYVEEYKGNYVPTSMFDFCYKLGENTELTTWLPSSFTGVGCAAFRGTKFTINFDNWNNLAYIGARAFEQMPYLDSFTWTEQIQMGLRGKDGKPKLSYAFIGSGLKNIAFSKNDIDLSPFSNCSIEQLDVDCNSIKLNSYSWQNNTTLKNVKIKANECTIESGAFCRAKSLETFSLKVPNVTLGEDSFEMSDKLKAVDLSQCNNVAYGKACFSSYVGDQSGDSATPDNVIIYVNSESNNPRASVDTGLTTNHGIVMVTNGGTVDLDKVDDGFNSVTRAGYTAKWYEDNNFQTKTTDTTPQVGKTYYAKWTQNASMDANTDQKDDSQTATVTIGKPVEITVTVNPGDHMLDILSGKAKITFTDPSAVESLSCKGKTYTGEQLKEANYTLSVSDLMPGSGVATYAAGETAKLSIVFNKKGNQNVKIQLLDSDDNVLCESNTAVVVEEEKKPDDTKPENPVTTYALTVKDGTVKVNGKDATASESGAYAVEKDAKVEVTFDKTTLSDAQVFDQWTITPASVLNEVDPKSETISFTMPAEEVTIKAMTRDATIEDDGPNILGTAAMIGVGVAGTAVLGYQGYMIGTELYLNNVLPAGAAIPQNYGELALLVWTDAGQPAPAAVLAADATDEQKALTWAVENQLISADKAADASVTRWEVIQTWNQAQEMKH